MSHLSPEELLDIAEGARPASPHLAACEPCRRQLHELRAVMTSAAEVDVPEPSPLFWDHLSARVREAVAAEDLPTDGWFSSWRVLVPIAALAAVVLIAVLAATHAQPAPSQTSTPSVARSAAADDRVLLADTASDNAPFAFVADLASQMQMDAAESAGLVPGDAADHAVSHLSDDELRTLAELIKAEMPVGRAS